MNFVNSEERKITVIGAGLAGLTAAYRIEKLTGIPVDVYEARQRLGGRVFTVYMGSSYEELGGKFLGDAGEAPNIRSLIKEVGLEEESYEIDLAKRRYYFREKVGDWLSLNLHYPTPDKQLYEKFQAYAHASKNFGEVLDKGFSGNDLCRNLAELRMRCFEGNNSYDLSVKYLDSFWEFYEYIYGVADEKKPSTYSIDYVKGGNGRLIQKLADSLQGKIFLGTPLCKIGKEEDRISLEFQNGKKENTDILILAIPCSTLRDIEIEEGILPSDQKMAIDTLQYGTNAKILLPIKMYGEAPCFSSTEDMAVWFNKDNTILTLYSGGSIGAFDSSLASVSEKISLELPALNKLFPLLSFPLGIKPMKLEEELFAKYSQPVAISWIHEPYSKGSYSSWGPDQYDFFNEKESAFEETVRKVFRPVNSNIFFAGEHTTLEFNGTLEGAVESGERTARMVLRAVK